MNFKKLLILIVSAILSLIISIIAYTQFQPNWVKENNDFGIFKKHSSATIDHDSLKIESISQSNEINNSANLRDSIVNFGVQLLGTPYVYAGADTNGFDCSGFVYYVFRHFKINVPRSSSEFEFFGQEISINEVDKGDILLFKSPTRDAIGHIGIVSVAKGNESEFIHATSSKEMKVVLSTVANEGYRKRFIKALRVL